MVKVQIYANGIVPKELLPDRFANFLCDSLVIPTPRAPQVPFRMISSKLFRHCPYFKPFDDLEMPAEFAAYHQGGGVDYNIVLHWG